MNISFCYYLLQYFTICILFEFLFIECSLNLSENTTLNLDLFKNLDAEIGPQLSTLASEIGEQYSKTIAQYVLPYIALIICKLAYSFFMTVIFFIESTVNNKRNSCICILTT